jgi:hypothetical protein
MYRQYDAEQDVNEEKNTVDKAGVHPQMPYDEGQELEQQYMPWQGMKPQMGGRPMYCYPMMYGNQMDQYEQQEFPEMYRQQGMNYYHRPRPIYYRPRRRRRPHYYRPRPYINIYPFFNPYYYHNDPYHYGYDYDYDHDDEYDYDYDYD